MRRLAAGVFTARRVTGLKAVIAQQVDELLDGLTGLGRTRFRADRARARRS